MSSTLLRAYGDREGDGMMQMSFTLRIEPSAKGREAAKHFASAHGLQDPLVTTMELCGPGMTFFVVYGRSKHHVDIAKIDVPTVEIPDLKHDEIDQLIATELGRKIVVVGACTGSDAHTVGIDAIVNMKGYAGDKGLESYKWIEAFNLGSQVENDALISRALSTQADAILVSQVITQRDVHKDNALALIEMLREKNLRKRFVMLFGGPRIDHKLALELGFDAGFGPGTLPRQVASFVANTLIQRTREKL